MYPKQSPSWHYLQREEDFGIGAEVCRSTFANMARFLVRKGAEVLKLNDEGDSPFDLCKDSLAKDAIDRAANSSRWDTSDRECSTRCDVFKLCQCNEPSERCLRFFFTPRSIAEYLLFLKMFWFTCNYSFIFIKNDLALSVATVKQNDAKTCQNLKAPKKNKERLLPEILLSYS